MWHDTSVGWQLKTGLESAQLHHILHLLSYIPTSIYHWETTLHPFTHVVHLPWCHSTIALNVNIIFKMDHIKNCFAAIVQIIKCHNAFFKVQIICYRVKIIIISIFFSFTIQDKPMSYLLWYLSSQCKFISLPWWWNNVNRKWRHFLINIAKHCFIKC